MNDDFIFLSWFTQMFWDVRVRFADLGAWDKGYVPLRPSN